jgi:ABC-2 type transport system permease protein
MTVQTQPQTNRDLILAARQGLLPARGSGWMAGFNNMLAKELGEWFRTLRWLWQLLIWVLIIDGWVALMLFIIPALVALMPELGLSAEAGFQGIPPEVRGLYAYFTILVFAGPIGVIILAQDEVIQEKQSGTAAWILSKPASRPAFILTKLLSNILGALVFIVLVPGLVAWVLGYLAAGAGAPLAPFLAAAGIFMLGLIFFISLVILLGVICESRGPVMGIAFGILLGGMLLRNFIPQILYVLPLSMEGVAMAVLMGMPLPAMFVSQVISAAVLSIVFILVALWRFQRKEF